MFAQPLYELSDDDAGDPLVTQVWLGPPRNLGLYAYGFQHAANRLLESLTPGNHHQDALAYPIVMCLRQALELMLKQVIVCGRELLGEEGEEDDLRTHKLHKLWPKCERILRELWPDDSSPEITRAVQQFKRIDGDGLAFRYPHLLPDELKVLDLGSLAADVRAAMQSLDGAEAGIDYLTQEAIGPY